MEVLATTSQFSPISNMFLTFPPLVFKNVLSSSLTLTRWLLTIYAPKKPKKLQEYKKNLLTVLWGGLGVLNNTKNVAKVKGKLGKREVRHVQKSVRKLVNIGLSS